MSTPTIITVHNPLTPLLEVPTITRNMILPIQSLPLLRHFPHPTNLLTTRRLDLEIRTLTAQFLRHGIDIHTQILSQEISDLRVLVVPRKRLRSLGVGRVDIDVRGGVAVRAPAGLTAARHHVCVLVQAGRGVFDEVVDFIHGGVVDAESVFDLVGDEVVLLVVGGRGEEVFGVLEGEALGGVGGVGEGGGVPYVLRVGCVEF